MTNFDSHTGRAEHLWILALALIALAGSSILETSERGGLSLDVPIINEKMLLPEMCLSRVVFGLPCPGCGLTRSFAALAHGDFLKAVIFNPMGPVLFLACLFQVPYRIIEYTGMLDHTPLWNYLRPGFSIFTWIIAAGLSVVWILRLVCYFSSHNNLQCTF